MITSLVRRIGWCAQGLAAAATLVTLAAPTASAGVWEIRVGPYGAPAPELRAGTSYDLFAHTTVSVFGTQVDFYDNGRCIGSDKVVGNDSGDAPRSSVAWVPTTAGEHKLLVKSEGESLSITVNVLPTLPGGPIAPQPQQRGCGAVGSIDTGSMGIPGS